MKKFAAVISLVLILIAAFAVSAHASMKTLNVPTLDQDWITSTTGYNYNCGPTSATEVMSYWALHGLPNLMSAPPAGGVPDKSAQIVNLFRDMVKYTTYDNYDYTYTYATSQLVSELKSFLALKGYSGTVELAGFGKVTFARIKSETDAGRPVMLLVMSWSHWVAVKGYDEATQQLRVLWGHDTNNDLTFERTVSFSSVNAADTSSETGTNAVYIIPGNTAAACTYTISPSSSSMAASGGTGAISVSAPAGCSWAASTGVSWASITSGASGSGNGTVAYSVQANTGAARTVGFSIAGKVFSLTQGGTTSSGTAGYTLTVTKAGTGSGTVTVNPAGPTYASGTRVTLTAVPSSNSVFAGWSGACSGTQTTCTGTMSRNVSAAATFNARTTSSSYTISASYGTGGTISPSGSVTVASGSGRTFMITPNAGYTVSNVTVDGKSVGAVSSYTFSNVTANHTIAAAFTSSSTAYTLTITKAGTGSGTVTVNPAGPTYASGTRVTLTAVPASNSVFTGWSGACSGTQTTCTGTMYRNTSVTATFRSRY